MHFVRVHEKKPRHDNCGDDGLRHNERLKQELKIPVVLSGVHVPIVASAGWLGPKTTDFGRLWGHMTDRIAGWLPAHKIG